MKRFPPQGSNALSSHKAAGRKLRSQLVFNYLRSPGTILKQSSVDVQRHSGRHSGTTLFLRPWKRGGTLLPIVIPRVNSFLSTAQYAADHVVVESQSSTS